MKRLYHLFLGISLFLFSENIFGQDLDSLINTQIKPKIDYASATFKASRIINGHSVQQMKRKQLDFRISHRFGTLNSGGYGLFGLDQSTIHFSLECGVTDWLMLGVGRGSYNKIYDSFAKFRILRQSKGARTMPFSISYLTSVEMNTMKFQDPTRTNYFSSRMSFVHQLLIARKFSEGFSFQLSPTFIHRNLVASDLDMNDVYSMGFGARYKLSKRTSFNVEYYYTYNPNHKSSATRYYNSASVGIDIETGGHVFQIMLTNSLGMREGTFIPQTTDSWTNGGIHLGFNISRVFAL